MLHFREIGVFEAPISVVMGKKKTHPQQYLKTTTKSTTTEPFQSQRVLSITNAEGT